MSLNQKPDSATKQNLQTLQHRGYTAEVQIDFDNNLIVGRATNAGRVIFSFQGATPELAKSDFDDAIDFWEAGDDNA